MTRSAILLLLLLLSTSLWAQQTAPLAEEEALRKPVTVQHKMILLPDLLREVSRQTGVSLTCGRELANDKLTVFVREKPAAELLKHVATIVVGEWRKTGSGYMLVQTAQGRKWEEEYLAREREQGWKRLRQRIQELIVASRQDYAQLVEQNRKFTRLLEQSLQGQEPSDEQSRALLERGAPVGAQLHEYLMGWLFRRFAPSHWRLLESGEVIFASTFPLPNALPLPPEAIIWAREGAKMRIALIPSGHSVPQEEFVPSEENMPTDLMLLFRARPEGGELQYALVSKTPHGVSFERSFLSVALPPEASTNLPLVAYWRKWQTPADAPLPLLNIPVRAQPQEEQSPYLGMTHLPSDNAFTLADMAEQLAKRAEVHIVADAYRVFWSTGMPGVVKQDQPTLREWLRGVFRLGEQAGWWRVEGDTLLMKHALYPLYRRTELPEPLLRELERKAQEGRDPSLDDYARLAQYITSLHEWRMQTQGSYAVRFDIEPLLQGYPHLRFWAVLSPAQRASVLRQGVLTLDALSPLQQRAFWRAAWQGMLSSNHYPLETPQEPEGAPLPRVEVSQESGEQYEVVSPRMRYAMNDLGRLREFVQQQLAAGHLDADYQIKGFRTQTYVLRYFLYPGVRYSTQIMLKSEFPVHERRGLEGSSSAPTAP
ncbi:MAG: hypothetical protein RMK92_09650 [Armatimonadota bacterium]|nr:hypothetical protein [Armatimonadota bacterium]